MKKKLFATLLTLALFISVFSGLTLMTVGVNAVDNQVATNRNVELGNLTDFCQFNGNSTGTNSTEKLSVIQPGANNTNYAVEYNATNNYASILAGNLGTSIIKDADYGYTGSGLPDTYTVTFYGKLASNAPYDTAVFTPNLASQCFLNGTDQLTPLATKVNTATGAVSGDANYVTASSYTNTFLSVSNITLTKTWTKYTLNFSVSQKLLKTLYDAKHYGGYVADAYTLGLRLDGSSYAFVSSTYCAYDLDEMTVTNTVGRQFNFTTANTSGYLTSTSWLVFGDAPVTTQGATDATTFMTQTFQITNLDYKSVTITAMAQVVTKNTTGGDTWANVKGSTSSPAITIKPGLTETFTVIFPKQAVQGGADNASYTYTVANYFLRLNTSSLPVGTNLIVSGFSGINLAKIASFTGATATNLTALPKAKAIQVNATANVDTNASASASSYLQMNKGSAVVTDSGNTYISYNINNPSANEVCVYMSIRVTNYNWTTVKSSPVCSIPAGTAKTVRVAVPATFDAKALSGDATNTTYTASQYMPLLYISKMTTSDTIAITVPSEADYRTYITAAPISGSLQVTSTDNIGYAAGTTLQVAQNAAKKTLNGNVESTGTTGWGSFNGGSITKITTGGANSTANCMQFTPNGAYSSISFNFGPTVISDHDRNLYGSGAGRYKVTFWGKLADTATVDSAAFSVFFNSTFHQSAAQAATILKGNAADYTDTYFASGTNATMTKTWQQFTAYYTVTDKYLATIKALYDAGNTSAYDLILRLDGSSLAFTGLTATQTQGIIYQVDEVNLTSAQAAATGNGMLGTFDFTSGTNVTDLKTDGGGFLNGLTPLLAQYSYNYAQVTLTNNSAHEFGVKMGIYVNDSFWSRVGLDDATTIVSQTDGVYKRSDGYIYIPAGETVTIKNDVSTKPTFNGGTKLTMPINVAWLNSTGLTAYSTGFTDADGFILTSDGGSKKTTTALTSSQCTTEGWTAALAYAVATINANAVAFSGSICTSVVYQKTTYQVVLFINGSKMVAGDQFMISGVADAYCNNNTGNFKNDRGIAFTNANYIGSYLNGNVTNNTTVSYTNTLAAADKARLGKSVYCSADAIGYTASDVNYWYCAQAASNGYTFNGWFKTSDNTLFSTERKINILASQSGNYYASYTLNTRAVTVKIAGGDVDQADLAFSILDSAGKVRTSFNQSVSGSYTFAVLAGDTVQATATAGTGYFVKSWNYTGLSKVLSDTTELSVPVYSDASFNVNVLEGTKDASTPMATFVYKSFGTDVIIDVLPLANLTSMTDLSTITAPSCYGYTFTGSWLDENNGVVDATKLAAITAAGTDYTFTAQMTKDNTISNNNVNSVATYTVNVSNNVTYLAGTTVNAGTGLTEAFTTTTPDSATTYTFAAITVVRVKAAANNGTANFSYWTINGKVVTASASYTFYLMGDADIEAVYGAAEAAADATTNIIETKSTAGSGKVTFIAERCVDSDCTLVGHGLLVISATELSGADAASVLTLTTTNSKVRRAVGTSTLNRGTYIVTKTNLTTADTWYAVSYVTYTDANNVTHTIYSSVASIAYAIS